MGDGIDHVFAPATSYFATDALSINANWRWLLLMTDGAHNSGTHNPLEFILPAAGGTAAPGTSLSDKKIKTFAVGYGVTGHSDVNPTLLQQLVAGSYPVGEILQTRRRWSHGHTGFQCVPGRDQGRDHPGVVSWRPARDVSRKASGGSPLCCHATRYDRRSAFVLSWNTPDFRRMRLELITPTCDLITPETAGRGPFRDIEFRGGNRSNMYMVGADFLRNAADPTRPRYGTWTLRVLSPQLTDSGRGLEHYDYDIIVDSDLSMAVKLDRASYHAGDPIRVSTRVLAAGTPVKGATVVLSTTAPQQSESNWLAGLNVPPEFLRRAQEMVRADSSPILIKATAARLAGMKFPGGSHETNLAMTIRAVSAPTRRRCGHIHAGNVHLLCHRHRRDRRWNYIPARGKGRHQRPGTAPPRSYPVGSEIPRRRARRCAHRSARPLRQCAAAGSRNRRNFQLNVTGADFAGPLINNVDGTYSRPLRYDPVRTPAFPCCSMAASSSGSRCRP